MRLVSIGWSAQSAIAASLAHCGLPAPELYAGQKERTNQQIADLCAALKHPDTDAAVLIVGPRAEVFAVVDPIRRQLETDLRRQGDHFAPSSVEADFADSVAQGKEPPPC